VTSYLGAAPSIPLLLDTSTDQRGTQPAQGPYTNQVQASGDSPADVTLTDDSQDGSDPDPNHNGDAGDNNDPTQFILTLAIGEIPTLSTWGLLALALLLAGVAGAADAAADNLKEGT